MRFSKSHGETLLYRGFLALLFWAPLPFASNRPWGGALLVLASSVLAACWLLLNISELIRGQGALSRLKLLPVVLLLLVQVGVYCQTIPLPHRWVELLSPHAAGLHLLKGDIPLSLDAELTRRHWLHGMGYTLAFVLTGLLINTRDRARQMLWTLVLSGAFQSIYGVMMVFTGLEYGFFVEKYSGREVVTGTFVNRNHLSGYLVMCLAAGAGLLISQLGETRPGTFKDWMRRLAELVLSTKFRLRILLALMVVALLLTRSRMGNIAFFFSLSLAGLITWSCSERKKSSRIAVLLGSMLLVDLVIVGQWFGTQEVADRIVQTRVEEESIVQVTGYSLDIIRDYPLTGSGGGTFYTVFPHYSDTALKGDYYIHAHNDYVEMASDMGLPLIALLGVFVLLTLAQAFLRQFRTTDKLSQGVGFAGLMAIFWAALHATVDFNLYIPANAFTLCALLGLVWHLTVKPGKEDKFP